MFAVTINAETLAAQLTGVAHEQFPFALANALNRTAEEAVQEEIKDLPGKFIVRRNWVAKGFRVQFAKKRKLVATIQHKDPFMGLQEFGGEKHPLHTHDVAIPLAARPSPQAITPRSKWPSRFKRGFYIRKGDTVYEFARSGRRHRVRHKSKYGGRLFHEIRMEDKGLDPNLKLIYVFKASVPIKPRLGMKERLMKTANARFSLNLAGMLDYAIRTAK